MVIYYANVTFYRKYLIYLVIAERYFIILLQRLLEISRYRIALKSNY